LIDLRSDTVTRPTAAMRRAMAEAVVGDDVYGEDPTVLELQSEAAALFGREAALFFPSGSQANQAAARLHTAPGEEVAVGEASHTLDWEMAGLAALSGLQARVLPTSRGAIDPEAARAALRPAAGGFRPACRLLVVENTHNFHGGAVVPVEHLAALRRIAQERGARVHLDGARLWNAAVASKTPLAAYGRVADTLMLSLSKGLGAPVGSLLVGDGETIARARHVRKLLGGGMRQVGVLAAAALVGLRTGRDRLAEDHARARRLADALLRDPRATLPHGPVETNIVVVRVQGASAPGLLERLRAHGVLAGTAGPDALRFVTHYDVDDDGVGRAAEVFAAALRDAV
jgi:threonine aldolase